MNKICGIYKITSPTGKIYIGQSINIKRRITRYKSLDCKNQYKLYNSLLKYGWDSHNFEIICECNIDILNDIEKYYIKFYNTFNSEHGMNLTDGGDSKRIISLETRLKMSISKKGKYLGRKASPETIQKLKDSHIVVKLSEETLKKRSQFMMGNTYNKGKHPSIETIEKLREIRKKFKHSDESKIKMSNDRKILNSKKHRTYEIYDQNDILIYKFKGVFDIEMKKLNLPSDSFRKTYLNNVKIKIGKYKNWFAILS